MIAKDNELDRLRIMIGAGSVRLDCDPDDLMPFEKRSLRNFVYSFAFHPEYAERVRRGFYLKHGDWEAQLADGVLIIARNEHAALA